VNVQHGPDHHISYHAECGMINHC